MLSDLLLTNERLLRCLGTLKDASADSTNHICMVDSSFPAVCLDKVAEAYASENRFQKFHSTDALVCGRVAASEPQASDSEVVVLVEFKNGTLVSGSGRPNRDADGVKMKAYCSVLLLMELTGVSLAEFRKSVDYVLVYNPLKNEASSAKSVAVSSTGSLDVLAQHLHDKAHKRFVRFGLHALEGFCFNKVYTLTTDEFEGCYLHNVDSAWEGIERSEW